MIPHFRYNRTFDIPLNHDQCRQYVSDIVELKRDKLSLVEKVRRAAARACTLPLHSSRRFSLAACALEHVTLWCRSPGRAADKVLRERGLLLPPGLCAGARRALPG